MYEYRANIFNVVDGDTVDATIDVGFHMTAKLRLRLLGVNAPEMHGESRVAGEKAKHFTTQLLDQDVVITTHKSDSFGRWLANISLSNGKLFNDLLIQSGNAVPFMIGE